MILPPWPTFDEDDYAETELMDVPTEIALGRGTIGEAASRAGRAASSEILAGEKQTDVVGLLSMDGKRGVVSLSGVDRLLSITWVESSDFLFCFSFCYAS